MRDRRRKIPVEFHGSPAPTIGVEIELQTIDPETKALIPAAPKILALNLDPEHIKKELLKSTLEVNTPVCQNLAEVEEELLKRLRLLFEVGRELGISFISAGTHPFSPWREQEVTEDPRYKKEIDRIRWCGYRLTTFGLHVHIGVSSGEKVIAFLNVLSSYLPHLLALSASSPFWEARDTGLASVRSKVFESLPGGGIPYRVRNWYAFQSLFHMLRESGTVRTVQEIWWDIRPHVKYGTLEVRVCDAMSSVWELLGVVAFVQTLVVWLDILYERGIFLDLPRHWVISENKWRAARWGLDCRLIVDNRGRQLHIQTALEDLLEDLESVSKMLGNYPYFQRIEHLLRFGGSYMRQRLVYERARSNPWKEVVSSLERELYESVGDSGPARAPRL